MNDIVCMKINHGRKDVQYTSFSILRLNYFRKVFKAAHARAYDTALR